MSSEKCVSSCPPDAACSLLNLHLVIMQDAKNAVKGAAQDAKDAVKGEPVHQKRALNRLQPAPGDVLGYGAMTLRLC